jgi:hypothetical protein
MSLPVVALDFIPRSRTGGRSGFVLLILGLITLGWTSFTLHQLYTQAASLELRLDELMSRNRLPPPDAALTEELGKLRAEAVRVVAALRTPWSLLLTELERASEASHGAVALVGIEPDRTQSKVRLVVEARSFSAAFLYVQALQTSMALRDPLLDSHEILTQVTERPVRVQITADWSQSL